MVYDLHCERLNGDNTQALRTSQGRFPNCQSRRNGKTYSYKADGLKHAAEALYYG